MEVITKFEWDEELIGTRFTARDVFGPGWRGAVIGEAMQASRAYGDSTLSRGLHSMRWHVEDRRRRPGLLGEAVTVARELRTLSLPDRKEKGFYNIGPKTIARLVEFLHLDDAPASADSPRDTALVTRSPMVSAELRSEPGTITVSFCCTDPDHALLLSLLHTILLHGSNAVHQAIVEHFDYLLDVLAIFSTDYVDYCDATSGTDTFKLTRLVAEFNRQRPSLQPHADGEARRRSERADDA